MQSFEYFLQLFKLFRFLQNSWIDLYLQRLVELLVKLFDEAPYNPVLNESENWGKQSTGIGNSYVEWISKCKLLLLQRAVREF